MSQGALELAIDFICLSIEPGCHMLQDVTGCTFNAVLVS